MSAGREKNYDFREKRIYRRQVARFIARSIPKKERREAVGIYLGGIEDRDRQQFVDLGFRSRNLICIDESREVCAAVRRAGGVAICGELTEVCNFWTGPPVSFVYADFCGGATRGRSLDISLALTTANIWNKNGGTAAVVNFLRGRDGRTRDEVLDWIKEDDEAIDEMVNALYGDGIMPIDDVVGPNGQPTKIAVNHRGILFWLFWEAHVATTIRDEKGEEYACKWRADCKQKDFFNRFFAFYSYKSGALVFDSIFARQPAQTMGIFSKTFDQSHPSVIAAKRNIAAGLALRTQAINNGRIA